MERDSLRFWGSDLPSPANIVISAFSFLRSKHEDAKETMRAKPGAEPRTAVHPLHGSDLKAPTPLPPQTLPIFFFSNGDLEFGPFTKQRI